eukprot:scpid36820/ scgid35056/ 
MTSLWMASDNTKECTNEQLPRQNASSTDPNTGNCSPFTAHKRGADSSVCSESNNEVNKFACNNDTLEPESINPDTVAVRKHTSTCKTIGEIACTHTSCKWRGSFSSTGCCPASPVNCRFFGSYEDNKRGSGQLLRSHSTRRRAAWLLANLRVRNVHDHGHPAAVLAVG